MSESSSFPRTGRGRPSRPELEGGTFSRGGTRSRSRSRERRDPPRTSVTDTWIDRDSRDRDSRRSPSPSRQGSRLPPRARSPSYTERGVKRPRLSSLDRARSSRDSSIEPGQYAPRSAVQRRRSPSYSTPELSRRPSSSSSHGPSPIKRRDSLPTSGRRIAEPVGRVDSAMLAFSRAMHSAMLSTSKHALASESFTRLSSFPSGKNNEAAYGMIREAQSRVDDAEAALKRRMWELQQAFDAVLKTRNEASSSPGPANVKTPVPAPAEINDTVDRNTKAAIEPLQGAGAAASIDAGRSKALQPASADPAAATNDADVDMLPADEHPASDRPAVSDTVEEEREGAKIRLRTLIGNLEHRVQEVESMKTSLEDRYFDLENEFYVLHEDFVQQYRSRARPETWEAFERERGSLRHEQVEEVDPTIKGAQQAPSLDAGEAKASIGSAQATQADPEQSDPAQPSTHAEDMVVGQAPTARPTNIASEPQDLPLSERTLEAIKAASAETLGNHELFLGALQTIGDLRAEVDTLKTMIQRIEDGRVQRERLVIEDALKRAREDYTSIVGAELAKAVRNVNASRVAGGPAAQPPSQSQPSQSAAAAYRLQPAAVSSLQPYRAPSAPPNIAQRPSPPTPSSVNQPTGPGPRAQSAGAAPVFTPISAAANASLPPRPAASLSAAPQSSQLAPAARTTQQVGVATAATVRPPVASPAVAIHASHSLAPGNPAPTWAVSPQLQSRSTTVLGLKERLAVPPPASSSPSGLISPTLSTAVPHTLAPAQQASYAPLAQRLNNASPLPLSGSSLQNWIASGGRVADGSPVLGSDTLGTANSQSLQSRIESPTKASDPAGSAPHGGGAAVYQARSNHLAHPAQTPAAAAQSSEPANGQNMSALASRITSAQLPQKPQQQQQQPQDPQQLAWLHANGQPEGATPQLFQPQNQSWQPPR